MRAVNPIKRQTTIIDGFFIRLILFSAINKNLRELIIDIDSVPIERGITKSFISEKFKLLPNQTFSICSK